MEEAIQELESYLQGMIDQKNLIKNLFPKEDQTEHTKKDDLRIKLRIQCLNKTIRHLKKVLQNQQL